MEKLAIIGTGIAGMGCAHHLQHKYDITLFEQNDYVGGHTNTISVEENGRPVYIDTGFMVFNYATYPHLCGLFEDIQAPVKKTDMSFSVQHVPTRLEYCGSGLNGLFAQRRNLVNGSFIKMLWQITRFNKEAIGILDNPAYEQYSLKDFIEERGYGKDMLWKYLVPMSSAVWSTPMELMLDFPAHTLIRFFKNHGFLGLHTQHQWYTLHNGSQAYRKLLIEPFRHRIQLNNAVINVKRMQGKALVQTANGLTSTFDKVIFACHADQALRLLDNPTPREQYLLSRFQYQYNKATVHTDESIMPLNRRVWSSWNYRVEERDGKQVPTTIYWMNRLQQVSDTRNYFVSINALPGSIDAGKIIREIDYEHPLFDVPAVMAQKELPGLNADGPLYYCGSYFRYGFHEDAYASAVSLSKLLKHE
ncbi:Predicted NAD/FAD-binding protein [Filimonas lacunae]|uniref:Predicted NAD/FAD-binding protein n=1 Tax=Filimonas lacunae TaxID=477680 RepID=A0A173MPS9_9BACT|nr:FAD-dependent oxidoreductase [Filimonas lacunae]BAV09440.1 amine oxidase, flavin-containing [Filimonas lacunae]SIS73192.1 Predicted NAD/FAD-binding protein [Filimonas lacunae]